MALDVSSYFDPTPYQATPMLPLQTLAVLAKALSSRLPEHAPPYIVKAERAMANTVEEAEQAMLARLREANAADLAADLALDNGFDGIWGLGRDRLRGWERYLKPGLDVLLDDPKLDFAAIRERAERAGELLGRLFGDGSLALLNSPFAEQSQLMANLLALIEADGHTNAMLDLAGAELLPVLRRCQVAYEAMVDRRSGPDTRPGADLRMLRTKLQRRILAYSTLVLTLIDDDDIASIDRVQTALLPMVSLRNQRRGPGPDDDSGLAADGAALLEQLSRAAHTPDTPS